MTDVFTGEPGFSAPLYELDFAPQKPRCDVLLNGSAYAPGGRPTTKVQVTLQVGSLSKSFNVVGNRVWAPSALAMTPTSPEPFTVMPIAYDNAFGGIDKPGEDPNTHQWYLRNPVGVGYHLGTSARELDGKPLPNTEEITIRCRVPMAATRQWLTAPSAAVGRRASNGRNVRPALDGPQAAVPPRRLRRPLLSVCARGSASRSPQRRRRGGADQSYEHGRTVFTLPVLKGPFAFSLKNGEHRRMAGVVDTLLLEPDLGRFTLSLRASFPLRRNLHEVAEILVGHVYPERPSDADPRPVRAKPHYKSLRDLPRLRREDSDVEGKL